MNNLKFFFTYIFLFSFVSLYNVNAQQQKTIQAVRVEKAPKIDGNPSDIQWQQAPATDGFYMFAPGDGTPLSDEFKTKIKIVYDDAALYVLAVMNDPEPDKIIREFGLRDQFIQADNFSILLNPFSTPNNTYMFLVTASGSQADGMNPQKMNLSWNAVWDSAIDITNEGWVVEMAIPYSALRFQNENKQTWSIGFIRHIERKREDYSWTYIDKTKSGGLVQFLGKLTDLNDLKPPVRLSLYPYASVILKRFEGTNDADYGFGLDLKYGLSENYTLDATLIPDFSDTPYDDLELNLGPFEQYYDEKRQFFTEGFDLFNKGRLFYSRRVGGTPSGLYSVYGDLNSNEILIDNPEKVKLINAVKISGRSKNGLGIGFFNAITNKTEAVIRDNISGNERKITTEPYANYNIFVMDYNYKGNSSISLINTNVIRQGDFRDANVTGLNWDIYAQNNTLSFGGTVAMSLINEMDEYNSGFKYILHSRKRIKQHVFKSLLRVYDDKFDSNDLGFQRKNNYANFDIGYSYNILKPTKHLNVFKAEIGVGFDHRYKPFSSVQNDVEINVFATNKKYLSFGGGLEYVTDAYDWYEPRLPNRYYLDKAHGGVFAFLSTDYRKKVAIDLKLARFTKFNDPQNYYSFKIAPRLKFGNKFKINYSFDFSKMNNGKGFVDIVSNDVIFGERQQKTVTNTLGMNYYFTTKSAVNLNFRYYWSPVYYTKFYLLKNDGNLSEISTYTENKDINYNIWNVDLGYIWEFAPGSKLSLLYRNTIFNTDQLSMLRFDENFSNLMKQPLQHTFIMKMTYYLDYNTVKNKWF
jgi:hypothetical protein